MDDPLVPRTALVRLELRQVGGFEADVDRSGGPMVAIDLYVVVVAEDLLGELEGAVAGRTVGRPDRNLIVTCCIPPLLS